MLISAAFYERTNSRPFTHPALLHSCYSVSHILYVAGISNDGLCSLLVSSLCTDRSLY